MLWFRNKDKNETVKVNCSSSNLYNVTDCRLDDLRDNQAAQKAIKERIEKLKDKSFPMVCWWIVVCRQMPTWRLTSPNKLCRGDINTIMRHTADTLKHSHDINGINVNAFDVEQFCKEIKDLFNSEQEITELTNEYYKLVESEKRLKEILNIT